MSPTVRFWSYDPALPSFRHRSAPLASELERRGWQAAIERFPRRHYVRRILARRQTLAATDVLVLAKINLAPLEASLLRRLARAIVFDVDDAIWLGKPRSANAPPRRSAFRRHKFASSCRAASLVVAGNGFLAESAGRHAARVEVVPTGVELAAYRERGAIERDGRVVVWIGLPENLPHLELVRRPLARLVAGGTKLTLRVVSSRFPDWTEIPIERRSWSPESEADALATAGVGVMPLPDDDWSRGKCAFKLLQYMAAGLPCVASPVGANREVVVPEETGLWASGDDDWTAALSRLLGSPADRERLGAAGRGRIRTLYDRAHLIPHAADLVEALARADRR